MNHQLKCLKIFVWVALGIATLGWLVMMLWNWLIPSLFSGSHEIDYAHAIGLLLLSKILFGGFRGHGAWHEGRHRCRDKMQEACKKWQNDRSGKEHGQ